MVTLATLATSVLLPVWLWPAMLRCAHLVPFPNFSALIILHYMYTWLNKNTHDVAASPLMPQSSSTLIAVREGFKCTLLNELYFILKTR